jgi:hypothetical protein
MPSVTRSRWTVCALLSLAPASLLSLALGAAEPRPFPQASGERSMFVSVLDKSQAPVPGLTAADFVVREDGVAREVLRAEKATDPVTLTLLVDTSQAATPFIADMRRALAAFVNQFGGRNPIAIWGFGERPTQLANYTEDVPTLLKAVDRVFQAQGSGSYLLQAVDDSCKELNKRDFTRAVTVAITAGGPEFSDRNYTEFNKLLPDCGSTLDVFSFDLTPPNLADWGQRNREQFIDAGTRVSGGDRFPLLSSMALEPALTRLADELAKQYRVTYFHPDRLIPPSKIEVSVKRPGLTARGTPVKVKRG